MEENKSKDEKFLEGIEILEEGSEQELSSNDGITAAKNSTKEKTKKTNKALVYVGRFFATLGVTVAVLAAFLYGVMFMLVHGPSVKAADLFVMSVRETSAMGFLADWFFTEEEIKEIEERNSVKDTDAVTDTSLVEIPDEKEEQSQGDSEQAQPENEQPEIEVIDISGATYKGKLMIIKDPSRLFVGTVPQFSQGDGLVVSDMAANYGAVAGINGGEFVDGENTYTAMPVGLVMTNGEIKNGDENTVYHVTGITYDNILVVGNISGKQAKEMGVRDCVSISNYIGPFLIVNGEATDISGIGGGLNPRTAIGQRADGAILLLAIDGRQASSIGATFADLQFIMKEYGAVNASTMDGGTSTQMYYNGEVINEPYSPMGPRRCPTAFLIK